MIRDSSIADGQTLEHARNHSRDLLRQLEERQMPWVERECVSRAAHGSLRIADTAYALANEGRRLLDCDRLTVLTCHGQRCRVEAVSGQDVFDRRSGVVRQLEHLAQCAVKTREPLWYTGEGMGHAAASLRDLDASLGGIRPRDRADLPPQLEAALDAFLDESHSRQVVVLPLLPAAKATAASEEDRAAEPSPPVGVLVIEQFRDVALAPTPGFRESAEFLRQTAAQALANAVEHEGMFLAPVSRALSNAWGLRRRPWTKFALAGAAIVVATLCLVPAELELQGRGTLEPVGRHDVFAPLEGVVDRVHVQHDSVVEQNQLLVELRNTDLEVKRTDVANQIATNQERLRAANNGLLGVKLNRAERDRLHSERAQLIRTLESLHKQLALYQGKAEQLQVRASMAGRVVTWDVQDLLMHRPVERGQMLLSLADVTGEWELEVRLPEDRMGHVAQAQAAADGDLPVSFILALDPSVTHQGTLKEVHARAEVHGDDGNTVLLRVRFDKSQLPQLRRGATVIAKVHCGRRSLGYVWFHDVWEFIESRVLFRL